MKPEKLKAVRKTASPKTAKVDAKKETAPLNSAVKEAKNGR